MLVTTVTALEDFIGFPCARALRQVAAATAATTVRPQQLRRRAGLAKGGGGSTMSVAVADPIVRVLQDDGGSGICWRMIKVQNSK